MSFRRTAVLFLALPLSAAAQRFYPDDPMWKEPPPMHVEDVSTRELNPYVELFRNTFAKQPDPHIRAEAVNTLGEVPDSTWYTCRHYYRRMSIDELVRGPGNERAPAEGEWKVISGKAEGITPGFVIEDAAGRRYILKLDPPDYPEMASGAEVVASKFFHALGYNVPENYVVNFQRSRLRLSSGAVLRDRAGGARPLTEAHINGILDNAASDPLKGYRAVASLYLEGKRLGPFRFAGTRTDDPNDIVPHEHRRDLRGLYVFCAWLGHHDIKETNTLDVLAEENGRRFVKHYLVDFNAALGSDSVEPKRPRDGYEYLFAWEPSVKKVLTLGIWTPKWATAEFAYHRSIGRLEYHVFDPEEWKPRSPLSSFSNRLLDDAFWAAKQVMAFTDEEIRAIVETGQYSSEEAELWLIKCLQERRDKIGRKYFEQLLPLDRFRVVNGKLEFDDLAEQSGLWAAPRYQISWSRFENHSEHLTAIEGATGVEVPAWANGGNGQAYYTAQITAEAGGPAVTVYIRNGDEVVGVERSW